jgi:DNA-binding transcriptional LysR family regulator
VEIRHLRYFVAVADALNFSRAAERLHMSQPPLSRRIADLEAELGFRLFDRDNRRVALTAAGAGLLPHARAAVDAFESATRAARVASPAQRSNKLRVAFPPDTSPQVLLQLRKQLVAQDVDLNIEEATTAEQHGLLVAGELDIGVLRLPYDSRGLSASPPLCQTLGVVLPTTHPLASRKELRFADLGRSALVMFPRAMAPGLYDELLEICRSGGYVPAKIIHGVRMTSALLVSEVAIAFNTAAGFRVSFGARPHLTWRPLAEEPMHWWTSVAWRRNNRDPLLRLSTGAIFQALQDHDHWMPKTRPPKGQFRGKAPSK